MIELNKILNENKIRKTELRQIVKEINTLWDKMAGAYQALDDELAKGLDDEKYNQELLKKLFKVMDNDENSAMQRLKYWSKIQSFINQIKVEK